jgi:hypothetical protein
LTIWLRVKNNAASELAAAITDTATELVLKTGEGSRFPAGFPFHITIQDEILEVTGRVNDTLTVTRAQESTSAAAHNAGTAVRLNITAALIEELQAEIDAREPSLPLTTKGDLLAFGTALARLAAGSNGQYLQADSSQSLGMKWATLGGFAMSTSGSYTGNSTASRAIPHGLGVTPKLVMIFKPVTGDVYEFTIYSGGGTDYIRYMYYQNQTTTIHIGHYAITAMTNTDFYVGYSDYQKTANYTGYVYYWVAIG